MDINDGTFKFTVRDGEYDGKEITVDLHIISMILRDMEKSGEFRLPEMSAEDKASAGYDLESTYYTATPEFACELSNRIAKLFEFCTPSIALALWSELGKWRDSLKKNTGDSPS